MLQESCYVLEFHRSWLHDWSSIILQEFCCVTFPEINCITFLELLTLKNSAMLHYQNSIMLPEIHCTMSGYWNSVILHFQNFNRSELCNVNKISTKLPEFFHITRIPIHNEVLAQFCYVTRNSIFT